MDALEAIRTRRSIRRFKPDPISDAIIEEILTAAMSAPSAGNEQAWQFIVITDKSILKKVGDVNPNARMAEEAAAAILVCGDLSAEKYGGYWVQDCAAAVQNLLLAVHAKGLGAVWTGVYPKEDRVAGFRKMFNLPDHVMPMALIPIGHPAQTVAPENRYNKAKVHYNKW